MKRILVLIAMLWSGSVLADAWQPPRRPIPPPAVTTESSLYPGQTCLFGGGRIANELERIGDKIGQQQAAPAPYPAPQYTPQGSDPNVMAALAQIQATQTQILAILAGRQPAPVPPVVITPPAVAAPLAAPVPAPPVIVYGPYGPQQTLPQAGPQQILPQQGPQQVLPQERPQQVLPQERPQQVLPQGAPQQVIPQGGPQQPLPNQPAPGQTLPQGSMPAGGTAGPPRGMQEYAVWRPPGRR